MKISDKHSQAARRNLTVALIARKSRLVKHTCLNCGAERMIAPSVAAEGRKFCKWECRVSYMRGENAANAGGGEWMRSDANPNWKGGVSAENHERRFCGDTLRWRRQVFYRDRYTCQRCGLKPRKNCQLNAHHIVPWAGCPEMRLELNNGVTLCVACHKWVHSKQNVTEEYLARALPSPAAYELQHGLAA